MTASAMLLTHVQCNMCYMSGWISSGGKKEYHFFLCGQQPSHVGTENVKT